MDLWAQQSQERAEWNVNYFALSIMGRSLVFRQVSVYRQSLPANIRNELLL